MEVDGDNNHQIVSIIEACRCLGSDKITERRKNAENLDRLLHNTVYIAVIDENSDNATVFTWNDVFKAACSFLKKEVEKYKTDEVKSEAKSGVTQAQRKTRDNQLEVSSNFVMNVINMASCRKPRLDVDLVMEHCLKNMTDSFNRDKFGRDHLNSLNNDILSKRSYWSKLKPNLWLSLFLISVKLLRSPTLPPNITFVSLSTLLNYVVHHGTLQSDIFLSMKKKITFFIDVMNNKTMLVKEHHLVRIWLDTAIQLALTFGREDRSLLCTLTEKTLNTFLDLCHDHLEEMYLLVQYSILAVVAHHPHSADSGEPGFLVTGNIEDWQKIVRRLHSLTDFQIKILHQRCISGRSKSYELEPNQVTMAVLVARQIFSSSFDLAEVTRMGVLDETGTLTSAGPSAAKKKRLMSGLSELIERLRQLGPVSESIPWLQICTKFVSDYPKFPQHYEMKELLHYVIEVTHDCRQYDMMSHCFRLFRIVCIAHSSNTSDIVQPELAVKLWDSVWKCLAANECHSESFLLLATLLNYRLVPASCGRQLIQLLARSGGNLVPCDSSSIICLAAFIQQYPLPENLSSGLLDGEKSIRSILSEWLLDCSEGSSGTDLHFRVFYSLAKKQKPSIGQMDLSPILKQLSTPTSFDACCRNLESIFSYVQLLEDFDEQDVDPLSPSSLDVNWPGLMSIACIDEQLSLMANRCINMTIELEKHRNINSEVFSEIQHAIRFSGLVRNFVSLQKTVCTKQLCTVATLLFKAILELIFKEESVYSRHCIKMLTNLFQEDIFKRDDESEDFLRQYAWRPTFRKVESLLSSGHNNCILDQVRQSIEDEEGEEGSSKAISIFDPSVLETQSEQSQVGLFRLLGVISCPLSWENDKPEYRSMKMDLLCLLASINNQETIHYLQMSFSLLRPYSEAQSHSLDVNLVTDLVDLSCRLGRLFMHDHEVASAILDIVPRLAAHVTHCSTSKSKLMTLINSYRTGVQEDAFGPPVEAAYHHCIARLDCQWVWTDDGSKVALDLLEGFNRPLNSTVICTSRLIRYLFNDSWSGYLQESTLGALTNFIMNIQEEGEQVVIRRAVILQALSSIVVKSPWTEKNAIILMLRFASEHHGPGNSNMLGLLRSALELAARRLNVDYSTWMDLRLEYLLDRWLPCGELRDFPHSLYHCTECMTQEQFLKKYSYIVAPVVFLKLDNPEKLQQAAEMAGFLSTAEWFSQHLPAIVGKILPPLTEFLLAKQKQQDIVSASSINRFGQSKLQNIHQLLDKGLIQRSLQNGLHEFLIRLLSSVDDPVLTLRLFGSADQLPITSTFRYPKIAILEAARHFSPELIAQDNDVDIPQRPYHSLLLYLTSQPCSVHSLLVELYNSYESGCRPSDRLHSLVSVSVCTEMLISALLSDQGSNNILNYVFHSLIFWLGHLLRNDKTPDNVQHAALVIFQDLIKAIIPAHPEIVAKLLVNIVGYITPLAATRPLAMSLLDFLLLNHETQLQSVLNQLCPFPDSPQFAHLSNILDRNQKKSDSGELVDEMDNFLRIAQLEQFTNMPIESVHHLIKMLIQYKEELVKMYAELEDTDKQRRLRSLTCCLIRLAMNTKLSSSMIQAIATALGELGPGDLKTLVLHQPNNHSDMKTPCGQMENYARNTGSTVLFGLSIIPSLVRFLFANENVKLVFESGSALLAALKTFEGQEFFAIAQQFEWPSLDLLSLFNQTNKQDTLVKITQLSLDPEHFRICVHDDTMWIPSLGHSSWLIRLTSTLIGTFSTGFFSSLLPVCRLEPEFCSNLLPHLVETLLKIDNSNKLEARKVISEHLNKALLAQPSTNKESWVASLKTLLNIVQHLRLVKPKPSSKKVAKEQNNFCNVNFQLDLNYLNAAKAAHSCSAYFTTIMYAEIWLDILNTSNGHPIASPDGDHGGFINTPEAFNAVQELLFEAYVSTGEPDGRTGFQSLLSSSPAWDIRRREQESQWFQALECHDALAQQDHSAVLTALSRCGLYRTAGDLAASPNHSASPAVREFQYECSWRLGQWDLQESEDTDKPGLHQLVYHSLLALKNNDQLELTNRLTDSRLLIIDDLRRSCSLESCRSVYPALTSLRLINEIQDFAHYRDNIALLVPKWQQNDSISVADFNYSEPSLALRSVAIKELTSSSDNLLGQTLLQTCRLARQCRNYPVAGRYLIQMESFLEVAEFNAFIRLEKALTEWQRGDIDRALGTLRSLVTSLRSKSITSILYSRTLCLLGQWLHETRAENPRQILDLYLKKSLTAAENSEASSKWSSNNIDEYTSKLWGVCEARQVLASYADSLYKDLQMYMESREFETQRKLAHIRQGKVEELNRINQSLPRESKVGTEVSRAHKFMHSETNNDKSEFKELFLEQDSFLLLAVQNYLIGIHQDTSSSHLAGAFDVRVSRLISLWFDRVNRKNRALTDLLVKHLPSIPSHHWVPVLPQLAARLVVKPNDQLYVDDFPKLLNNLINRCLVEHPHHTLPVIMALSLTNKDKELEGFKVTAANEEERVTAAKSLIKNLTRRKEVGPQCQKLEQLSNELIKLANKDVKMYKGNKNDKHAELFDFKKWESENLKTPPELVKPRGGWEDVAVPTVTIPLRPDSNYSRYFVGIVSFSDTFELVGGINAPKKLTCRGRDGVSRPMLLKGKDDLRQDAVMQQVFGTLNTFLQQDESTRQRHLRIRTYKVVPLSRRSGLLEWCVNTMPIGNYLLGPTSKDGAHLHYARSEDLTTKESLEHVMKLDKLLCLTDRTSAFLEICARFPPVFRHFFLERYSSPSLWFEKRLNYTRSVAASSMVGYILGLGDRHLSNILIDETTAELIHIDLGIAFEQGRVLPIPELVPFRLTRDIIDPMGPLGVEGIFRRCCEFTMSVMRQQQDSILTLLEVLLYDPLYVWAVTPKRAAAVQEKQRNKRRSAQAAVPEAADESDNGHDSQGNESAKRTLVRLGQKLKGVEKGTPLSVAGQVNLLIQQARDPAHLCTIFHGWKPQA